MLSPCPENDTEKPRKDFLSTGSGVGRGSEAMVRLVCLSAVGEELDATLREVRSSAFETEAGDTPLADRIRSPWFRSEATLYFSGVLEPRWDWESELGAVGVP